MSGIEYELPYTGAKKMLLVSDADEKDHLAGFFDAMYDALPAKTSKKKR